MLDLSNPQVIRIIASMHPDINFGVKEEDEKLPEFTEMQKINILKQRVPKR